MFICPLEMYQLRVQRLWWKIKQLPDSAAYPGLVSLSLSFSLSPWQTWPYQGLSYVSFLSPMPFILRVPLHPAGAGPQQISTWNWTTSYLALALTVLVHRASILDQDFQDWHPGFVYLYFFCFAVCHGGIEQSLPAKAVQNLNHWTTRYVQAPWF